MTLRSTALFFVLAILAARAPAYAQSLILNGGFEEPDSAWVAIASSPGGLVDYDGTDPLAGSLCGRLMLNMAGDPGFALFYQAVTSSPGTVHLLDYALKVDADDAFVLVLLQYEDSVADSVVHEVMALPLSGLHDWRSHHIRTVTPPGADRLVLLLILHGRSGSARFDEIALTADSSSSRSWTIQNQQTQSYRPLSSVNIGPTHSDHPHDFSPQFQEMDVTGVRTHDYYGPCDMSQLFPDPSADPMEPASYDFAATDSVLLATAGTGCEILFRFGESYSNPPQNNDPPADPAVWAQAVLQIVRHYNDGWAGGYELGIDRFEIWNEPDIEPFWTGTVQDYVELYRATATALKQYDPDCIVGGPGAANVMDRAFVTTFLDSVAAADLPLDFFSWHLYHAGNPLEYAYLDSVVQSMLDDAGLTGVESWITEWNSFVYHEERHNFNIGRDDALSAALTASHLIAMQRSTLHRAFHYCATDHGLFGLFRWGTNQYSYGGLAMKALAWFGGQGGNGVPTLLAVDEQDRYGASILAGELDDGRYRILVADAASTAEQYRIDLGEFALGDGYTVTLHRTDELHEDELIFSSSETADSLLIAAAAPFLDRIEIIPTSHVAGTAPPSSFELRSIYPNPFNPTTTVVVHLDRSAEIEMDLFNLLGRRITTLHEGVLARGEHRFSWDGSGHASGIYLLRLKDGETTHTKKLLLLR